MGPDEAHAHVSGHACRDELAEMMQVAGPKTFVPVHGTPELLGAHGELAAKTLPRCRDVIVPEAGDSLVLDGRGVSLECRGDTGSAAVSLVA